MNFNVTKKILQSFIDHAQTDIKLFQKEVNEAQEELDEALNKLNAVKQRTEKAREELANLMRLEVSELLLPEIKSENKPTL